ncbi:methylated-DNA--[protein]-cysteine S-methyltransferase [Siminovitchia sediminis]|uniref:Methylated-DNA--protein-cysteine methyltransferase n=1 Tax=Siminovitchia sediminis TaxID=1274353 RepID=A0ABW4KEU9_9BACI
MSFYYTEMDSSIDKLFLLATDAGMTGIYFSYDEIPNQLKESMSQQDDHLVLKEAIIQLREYFQGKRQTFTVPLSIQGTTFQKAVWEQLLAIPYGETRSYADIAAAIENEKAVRAVGQANKANRLPILIPCHRVIGKNKSLTGYAGNQIDKKEQLLILEGVL